MGLVSSQYIMESKDCVHQGPLVLFMAGIFFARPKQFTPSLHKYYSSNSASRQHIWPSVSNIQPALGLVPIDQLLAAYNGLIEAISGEIPQQDYATP